MLLFNGSRFNGLNTCGVMQASDARVPWMASQRHLKITDNALAFGSYRSAPAGYQDITKAAIPTIKESGKMAVRFGGTSDLTTALIGVGKMAVTLAANSTLAVNAYEGHVRGINFAGQSAFAVSLIGVGKMTVALDAGARPSAGDIAQATIQATIEGGLSLAEVLRLLLAVAAGDATGLDGTPAFKSVDGSKTRVEGTRLGGTRNITIKDPS